MKTSDAGRAAIRGFEGEVLHVYDDGAGYPTAGVGHRVDGMAPGTRITLDQSDAWLVEDLADAELCVNSNVRVPLTQPQFDALVSLVFNIGAGAFADSTLLRKLNAGDYAGAADEFNRWHHAGGKDMAGLVTRRETERSMFLSEPAAPIEDHSQEWHPEQPQPEAKPMLPILAALLPTLIQSIPSLAKVFGGGTEVSDRNIAAVQIAADVVTKSVNAVNLQDAVSKIQSDPQALASAKAAVEENWFSIVGEAGGGGISGARQADLSAMGDGRFWRSPAFVVACLLLPIPFLILVSVLFPAVGGEWSNDVRATIAGSAISLVLGSLTGYYFGSTTTKNRPA